MRSCFSSNTQISFTCSVDKKRGYTARGEGSLEYEQISVGRKGNRGNAQRESRKVQIEFDTTMGCAGAAPRCAKRDMLLSDGNSNNRTHRRGRAQVQRTRAARTGCTCQHRDKSRHPTLRRGTPPKKHGSGAGAGDDGSGGGGHRRDVAQYEMKARVSKY
ncbi:hypothetical protein FB451DRAFT_1239401 [Mycena latifolia]|nr:hypothetical protein FB451DRAFT_1239401 [Mycena latifolia]